MKYSSSLLVLAAFILALGAGCAKEPTSITETNTDTSSDTSTDTSSMQQWTFPGILPAEQIENKQVRIVTSYGDIVIKLFPDTAPMAVSNFVYLITNGYYDGLTFHRRVEGFVLQGGDPDGTGRGGPGYEFPDELEDARVYSRGIVAMANKGADTNGSQFFVMLDSLTNGEIAKAYTIFGEVTEGMDVVDKVMVGDKMIKVTVEDVK